MMKTNMNKQLVMGTQTARYENNIGLDFILPLFLFIKQGGNYEK